MKSLLHHQRTGLFHNPVFTLPRYFQVLSPQTVNCFSAIVRTFLLLRDSTLQSFQLRLRLPQEFGILDLGAIGCFIEILQPQVNTKGFACGLNRFLPVNINAKLA